MKRILLLSALLSLAVALFLTGCPPPKPAEDAAAVIPDPAIVNPSELAAEPAEATAEVPTDLEGELVVGVPCGVAMAYQNLHKILADANPNLKFVNHIKNVGPMVKEILDDKGEIDVFLSLGDKEIQQLIDAGKVEGEPVPFLKQRMMLAVPLGNPLGIKSFEDLLKDDVKTVAVCDPSLSIGFYGQKALEGAGIWEDLVAADKIVRPDQPLKAKNMIIQKQADAAFIYAACASEEWKGDEKTKELTIEGKADVVMTVDEELYGAMNAVAIVVKNAKNMKAARSFVEFLKTPAAQEAISKAGYEKVEAGAPVACDPDAATGDDAPIT